MKKYILKRLAIALAAIFLILLILFLLLQYMPGSPFNEKLSDEQIAQLNAFYGLDDPFWVQFGRYVKNMLSGNFGVSYNIAKNVPVAQLLSTRLPISLRLGAQAVVLGAVVGLLLGILAAIKHNTIWDSIATVIAVIGVSLPSYVFALALSYFVGFRLKWLPLLYSKDLPFESSVMGTIALSVFTIASISRFTRNEMLEVLGSDYMLLAESKGLSGPALIFRHALRNALIPVVTVLAPLVVSLMTGSLVIEKIFSIPGIGMLMITAIQSNDHNVTITLAFIYSVMYIGIMLFVDILYGIIDPRIRLAKEG